MSVEKTLGKIESVRVGMGGYQDACFGVSFALSFGGRGCHDFKGAWSQTVTCDKHCKWTEADRDKQYADFVRFLDRLCTEAKVTDVAKLAGVPIEVTTDCFSLKSWRVLTEVI